MDRIPAAEQRTRPYAWYVLFVLFFGYARNLIDRQIVTVLTPEFRRDLDPTNADKGFRYGTVLGVFYAPYA